MSMRATAAAWDALTQAPTGSAKLVMLALAYWKTEADGDCWPEREWIQAATGLSERTVHEALGQLDEAGLISRFDRRDKFGQPASQGIVLLFDAAPARFAGDGGDLRGRFRGSDDDQPSEIRGSGSGNGVAKPQNAPPQNSPLRARGSNELKEEDKKLEPSLDPALDAAARAVWEAMPSAVKAGFRSGLGGVRKMLRPLGVEVGEGIAAYYRANPASYRKLHFLIADEDWRPPPPKPVDPALAAFNARWDSSKWGHPGHHPVGTHEDPGPAKQWRWLEEWFGYGDDLEAKAYWWELDKRGPQPTEDGTRVWPALLDDFCRVNGRRHPGAESHAH